MPKPGPRTTAKCSDEFKATAVRLSRMPGVAVQDVADSLYIYPFMLSLWSKQAREGRIGQGSGGEQDTEAHELEKLVEAKKKDPSNVIQLVDQDTDDAESSEQSADILDLTEVLRRSLSQRVVVTTARGSEPVSLDERRASRDSGLAKKNEKGGPAGSRKSGR